MTARPPLYPVMLDVAGRRCLVVGGGRVATHKVLGLVAAAAHVTVVAPDLHPDLVAMVAGPPRPMGGTTGSVAVHRRRYEPGEAADYRLVITATGRPEVDGAVAADAEAAGVWVNSADDPDRCSFILPAVHRDGPVSVAVSTAGASPALATWLRNRVATLLGPDLGALAELLAEARQRVRDQGASTEGIDWHALLDGPLPELVHQGRLEEARALLAAATVPTTHTA